MPIQSETAETESTNGQSPSLSDLESLIVRQTAAIDVLSGGLQLLEQRLLEKLTEFLDRSSPTEDSQAEGQDVLPAVSDGLSKRDPHSSASEPGTGKDVQQSWEAIRQALLSGMEGTDQNSESVPTTEAADAAGGRCGDEGAVAEDPKEAAAGDEREWQTDVEDIVLPDPVDVDAVEDAALREALIARDELIRQLASRLRNVTGPKETLSTEQLRDMAAECPEELRRRVENSLDCLDEQLRLTEMELSLERARLSRQAVQLETSQALLRHTARQMGLSLEEDGTLQRPSESDTTGSGRRWIRVLGFGGDSD